MFLLIRISFAVQQAFLNKLIENPLDGGSSAWANSKGELFVGDVQRYRIIKVGVDGAISVIAGLGYYTYEFVESSYGTKLAASKKSFELPVMSPRVIRGDSDDNIYFTDDGFNKINRISPSYKLTTIAGLRYGQGSGCSSPYDGMKAAGNGVCNPYGLHVDDQSRDVYFTERYYCRVFRIVKSTGLLEHIAGSYCSSYTSFGEGFSAPATSVAWYLEQIWVNPRGDVFVTVPQNGVVVKVSNETRMATVFFGSSANDGVDYMGSWANETYFPYPVAVTGDSEGNVYVYGQTHCRIRRIDSRGWSTHYAGTDCYSYAIVEGEAAATSFIGNVRDITIDDRGNLYLPKESSDSVSSIDDMGLLHTVVQPALSAPKGIWKDAGGKLFIADSYNNRVAVYDGQSVYTLIGSSQDRGFVFGANTTFTETYLQMPDDVVGDDNGLLFVASQSMNQIFMADLSTQQVTVVAGYGRNCYYWTAPDGSDSRTTYICTPASIALYNESIYFSEASYCRIRKFPKRGGSLQTVAGGNNGCTYFSSAIHADLTSDFLMSYMSSLWISPIGEIYVAMHNTNMVVKISESDQRVDTVVGTGNGGHSSGWYANTSMLNYPTAICGDGVGNLFIFNWNSYRLQKVDTEGLLHDYAGNGNYGVPVDGQAMASPLVGGYGLVCGEEGLEYFVSTDKSVLMTFTEMDVPAEGNPNGLNITTVVSNTVNTPLSVWEDAEGTLYVADSDAYQIVKIQLDGTTMVIAGVGYYSTQYIYPYNTGPKPLALLKSYELPIGYVPYVRGDRAGNIYFIDGSYNKLNRVSPSMKMKTIVGAPYGQSPYCNGYVYNGMPASSSRPCSMQSLHVDEATADVYFAELSSCRVLRMSKASGLLFIVAGSYCSYSYGYYGHTADPLTVSFYPAGVWANAQGDVYIATLYQGVVLEVSNTTKLVSVVAGDPYGYVQPWESGPAINATLNQMNAIGGDQRGNLYVVTSDCRVRTFTPGGYIDAFAGTGTCGSGTNGVPATSSSISSSIRDIYVKDDGTVVFADWESRSVRRIDGERYINAAVETAVQSPTDIWVDGEGNMYVTMSNSVVKFDVHGRRTVLMGGFQDDNGGYGYGDGENNNNNYYGGGENLASVVTLSDDNVSLPLTSPMALTALSCPSSIVGDGQGGFYVTDSCYHQIYYAEEMIDQVTVIAGYQRASGYSYDGEMSYLAFLSNPKSIALFKDELYYIEGERCLVRTFSRYGGALHTIAGQDYCSYTGLASLWSSNPLQPLYELEDLWVSDQRDVFFTSSSMNVLYRLDSEFASMEIFAGNGDQSHVSDVPINGSSIAYPKGLCGVNEDGILYVFAAGVTMLQGIVLDEAMLVDVAGNGQSGIRPSAGYALHVPLGGRGAMACKPGGIVYMVDEDNNVIRMVYPEAPTATVVPTAKPTERPPSSRPTPPPAEVSRSPSDAPTAIPSFPPTTAPTEEPTMEPTVAPSFAPTVAPTDEPTIAPSPSPTDAPSMAPTPSPTRTPTASPTTAPSAVPTRQPSASAVPSLSPSLGASETWKPTASEDEQWRTEMAQVVASFAATANRSSSDATVDRVVAFYEASSLIAGVSTALRGGCSAWSSFTSVQVPSVLSSMRVSYVRMGHLSSLSQPQQPPAFATCGTASVAADIVTAMANGANGSFSCDNTMWRVGTCGSSSASSSVRVCAGCASVCDGAQPLKLSPCTAAAHKFFQLLDIGVYAPSPPPTVTSVHVSPSKSTATVAVQTSTRGKVYVGVFSAAAAAPASVELIKLQNLASAQSDATNTTTLTLRGLVPATSYVVYVATESLSSGASSSLTAMLATATRLRTDCCQDVGLSSSVRTALAGSSYANVLQLSLDALPTGNLTATLSLAQNGSSRSVAALVPSVVEWSAFSVRSRSVSLLGTVSPGEYTVAVRLSGANAAEYAVSATVQLTVVSSQSPLPAPTIASAAFASDGSFATVAFSGPSDLGGLPTVFVCARLFAFRCADTSTCTWVDAATVRVDVSTGDTCAAPGQSLRLLAANQLRSACPVGSTCSAQRSWATAAAANVTFTAPAAPTSPQVQISAPSVLGSCASYALDVSASTGNGGRGWQSAQVRVGVVGGGGDGGSAANVSQLQSFLAQSFEVSPPTRIGSEWFQPGQSYVFTVTLCNFLAACSSGSATVSVLASAVPTVSIPGSSFVVTTASRGVSLTGEARLATCGGGGGASTTTGLSAAWTVSVDGAPTELRSSSRSPYTLLLAPYALQTLRVYDVVFTATVAGGKSSTAAVQVYVAPGGLQAVVSGGRQRSVRVSETLVVDGSMSRDEDVRGLVGAAAGLQFVWTCSQTAPVLRSDCSAVIDTAAFAASSQAAAVQLRALPTNATAAATVAVELTLVVADATL
eukprot:gene12063-8618_t